MKNWNRLRSNRYSPETKALAMRLHTYFFTFALIGFIHECLAEPPTGSVSYLKITTGVSGMGYNEKFPNQSRTSDVIGTVTSGSPVRNVFGSGSQNKSGRNGQSLVTGTVTSSFGNDVTVASDGDISTANESTTSGSNGGGGGSRSGSGSGNTGGNFGGQIENTGTTIFTAGTTAVGGTEGVIVGSGTGGGGTGGGTGGDTGGGTGGGGTDGGGTGGGGTGGGGTDGGGTGGGGTGAGATIGGSNSGNISIAENATSSLPPFANGTGNQTNLFPTMTKCYQCHGNGCDNLTMSKTCFSSSRICYAFYDLELTAVTLDCTSPLPYVPQRCNGDYLYAASFCQYCCNGLDYCNDPQILKYSLHDWCSEATGAIFGRMETSSVAMTAILVLWLNSF